MPIAITSEHKDLADSVRALVERVAPPEVLHAALETPISNPPPYWKAAAEQGLHGVHLAESVGGQGFGILELAVVIAEFGRGAVPGPFVPTVITSAVLAAAGPDDLRRARADERERAELRGRQRKCPAGVLKQSGRVFGGLRHGRVEGARGPFDLLVIDDKGRFEAHHRGVIEGVGGQDVVLR